MLSVKNIGLRGAWAENVDLKAYHWFRTHGRADFLFEPEDEADLMLFLRHCPKEVPLLPIGLGSNLLVRDGGVRGVVIVLRFDEVRRDGNQIEVGAGMAAKKLAQMGLDMELSGFEFMRGIPGSVGGCLAMNAGAYGSQTSDIFVEATAFDRAGRLQVLQKGDMQFGYRQACMGYIFTKARFEAVPQATAEIAQTMDMIIATRRAAQPAGGRTGGSTFKNPAAHISSKKAWQLIDDAGCRDFSQGDASICDKHCNFLINRGSACASDIEILGERIRAAVKEKTGILLEWEIRRVGEEK